MAQFKNQKRRGVGESSRKEGVAWQKGPVLLFSILFLTMFFSREMTTALNIKQGQKDCYHLLLCLVNDVCPTCTKVTQRGEKRCRSRSSSQIRDWARSGLGWVRDSNLELTREGRGWAGGRRRVAGCTRAPQLVMAKGHWPEVQAAHRKGQKADSGDQSGIFFSCHWQCWGSFEETLPSSLPNIYF